MEGLKIGLAADHAGFALKEELKSWLQAQGFDIRDYGTDSPQRVDYPIFAHRLARAIQTGEVERGIAMCGSGNGISMSLNRHRGVRAALAWIPEIAQLGREHNNANVLALPARFISITQAKDLVEAYLNASFQGERHQKRIELIDEI